jgi:hypothetical protein
VTRLPEDIGKKKLHLRYVGLEPRTLHAYRQALDNFLKFSKQKRLRCGSSKKLDHAISEFINHSYQEGDPISYAGHLLSAIKRFHPEFKLKLPLFLRSFTATGFALMPQCALLPLHGTWLRP